RQLNQLDTPAGQVRRGPDEKNFVTVAGHGLESGIDLAAGIGVEDLDLQPSGESSRFRVSHGNLGTRHIGWIDEHGNASPPGPPLAEGGQAPWHSLRL